MSLAVTAADAVPIYKGNDFFVPAFEIKIGKRTIDQSIVRDVTQVTYKDDIESIDSFELTINNWDAQRRTFKYSDSRMFDPGQEVELSMGYHGSGHMRLMLRGEITSMRPSFPASGQSTIAVSGLNILHRFRRKQISRVFEKKTDTEIARQVCQALGVTLLPNPAAAFETRNDYVLQDDKVDIVFLLGRARRLGYDLVVRENPDAGLYFGPSGDIKKTTYALTYGKSLTQFQPTLSTALQVSKVTVIGWDAKAGVEIKGSATRAQLKTDALTEEQMSEMKAAFGEREEVISDKPVRSKREADELALATLQRISGDMVTGSGSIVGLPDLRAGNVVFIDGLGANTIAPGRGRFDGRYFLTSTTHTIGSGGYTTQFECRREEVR